MPIARAQWSGWGNLRCASPIVPLAAALVAVESLAAWRGLDWRPARGVAITPVLPAAVLLASLVGWRGLGFSRRQLRAWIEFGTSMVALLVVVGTVYLARGGAPRALLSLLAGATEEELVFRVAAPIAAGGVAAWLLRRPAGDLLAWGTLPRVVAVLTAALTFTAGPGHLAQVGAAAWRTVPFLAVGTLLSYVFLRTGNVLAGLLVHAVLNLATVAYLVGILPRAAWALVVIAALGCFALGAERAGRRLGLVRPVTR